MRKLHLSQQLYTASWGSFLERWEGYTPDEEPVPLCGGSGPILRRGAGAGLVPPMAVSSEHHCPQCVAMLRGKEQ